MCVQCGREDIVIGDDTPLCLHCGSRLIKATKSYAGLYMSPEFVLTRTQRLVEKHGFREVAGGRFKHEREAWTTALYALALSEMYRNKYWVEIETVDQTPDTRVLQIDQTKGWNVLQTQNIEVVDWEEHVDDPMMLVKTKCQKSYPTNFCLLITARSGKMFYPLEMTREIRGITVPFAEIWIVALSAYDTFCVARLHPSAISLEFKISDAVKRAQTKLDVLAKRKRGKGTEFVPMGDIYLPIP